MHDDDDDHDDDVESVWGCGEQVVYFITADCTACDE